MTSRTAATAALTLTAVAIAVLSAVVAPSVIARAGPDARRGDEDLLPADEAIPGWRRAEPPRVYSGSELYELIDGGAEIFFEHGFERVTIQKYALGSDEIVIDLYAMRDAAAALGIYLGRCGDETPAPGLDLRHTAGRHELLAVQGGFYVVVENLSGRAERAADLVAFARALAPRLPTPQAVPVLDLLPTPGRVPGSERLVRGPLALQSFIQLGDDDILQLGGRVTAAAAGYQGPRGRFTLVVVPYADGAAARRAFEHVGAHLDPEIRPLSRTTSRLVFRDYSATYGEVLLDEARIELRLGLAERP